MVWSIIICKGTQISLIVQITKLVKLLLNLGHIAGKQSVAVEIINYYYFLERVFNISFTERF